MEIISNNSSQLSQHSPIMYDALTRPNYVSIMVENDKKKKKKSCWHTVKAHFTTIQILLLVCSLIIVGSNFVVEFMDFKYNYIIFLAWLGQYIISKFLLKYIRDE